MTSPEPGLRRAPHFRHRLLGVDSDGTAPALHPFVERGEAIMEIILIVVVLLFLFGGGGYYWNSRRG
jgi:hypothetical protein